jgi:hypothetical protein
MPKLRIRVEKLNKQIDEVFADIEGQGKITRFQNRVFKAVYKSRLNGLYFMIRRTIGRYIEKEGNDFFEAVDTENIELQKVKLEKFLYGSENELKKEAEYNKFKNDRVIIKVLNYMKKKAIGEFRVVDFFSHVGISITLKVEQ